MTNAMENRTSIPFDSWLNPALAAASSQLDQSELEDATEERESVDALRSTLPLPKDAEEDEDER